MKKKLAELGKKLRKKQETMEEKELPPPIAFRSHNETLTDAVIASSVLVNSTSLLRDMIRGSRTDECGPGPKTFPEGLDVKSSEVLDNIQLAYGCIYTIGVALFGSQWDQNKSSEQIIKQEGYKNNEN